MAQGISVGLLARPGQAPALLLPSTAAGLGRARRSISLGVVGIPESRGPGLGLARRLGFSCLTVKVVIFTHVCDPPPTARSGAKYTHYYYYG